MKKLLISSVFLCVAFISNSQVMRVYYDSHYTCNSNVFFAVLTETPDGPFYRFTETKNAEPGSIVSFDLESDMSSIYVSASEFSDPTRPMFGGSVGESGITFYFDANMAIGDHKIYTSHLCSADNGGPFYTRDGDFRFIITDRQDGVEWPEQ